MKLGVDIFSLFLATGELTREAGYFFLYKLMVALDFLCCGIA